MYRGDWLGLVETTVAPVSGSKVNVFWRTLCLLDGYVVIARVRCAV